MFRKSVLLVPIALFALGALGGCGIGPVVHTSELSGAIQGRVHGGQQPVAGSTIQLYTVGSAGNGSAATPMLTRSVTTDGEGNFDISSAYTCGKSSTGATIPPGSGEVYVVASGGNPGQAAGTNNHALLLVAALGSCAALPNATFVEVNEVTTVAAAWALAAFMNSSTQLGASPTNADGMRNAFADAALLADTTTGLVPTLPANLSIEQNKLYGLADALASCVNSDGLAACNPLFGAATPSGGTRPGDTLAAALNIVKHPGQNVVAVYQAIAGAPPFPSGLLQAPNDWTMALTITGGGLAAPTALAIDQASNVWVAGEDGPLSAFSPQGQPLSATGFGITNGVTDLTQTFGLTVDSDGDIWITNFNALYKSTGSVVEFYGSNAPSPHAVGDPVTFPGPTAGISYPEAAASDGNHHVYFANNGNGTATVYSSSGALVSSYLGYGLTVPGMPLAIAVDSSGGFWLPDSGRGVEHISADGTTLLSYPQCCFSSHGVATDAMGNVWVSNYLDGSFSEVASTGTILLKRQTGGGLTYPQAVAVDAGQNVWFANFDGGAITEIAGYAGAVSAGTPISPTTGVYGDGGYGLDNAMVEPASAAPDRSGNIWVANGGEDNVVMFFGLATPTVTPVQPVPTAP